MKYYIRYMVSIRCKMLLKSIADELNIEYKSIELGTLETCNELDSLKFKELKDHLHHSGLELIDDKKKDIIESIKAAVVEMIFYSEDLPRVNYSIYLSKKLNYDYTYLSNLFSTIKGITIQQFIINSKIEKVKELLLYDNLTLSEISYKLDYSSVAHLSNQFKKVTGQSPSYFKNMQQEKSKQKQEMEMA